MPVPDENAAAYHALLQAAVGNPGADNFYRLGCWLHDNRHWGSAAAAFGRVAAEQPENHRALCNMGWNLHLQARTREALPLLDRAVALAPEDGMPRALRCQVRMILGDLWGSVEDGRLAVEYGPGEALNHLAYSFALINAGKYREGWQENEHRFAYTLPEFLTRPYRFWRGEWVQTLYVECEQGNGDAIFALRWLPEAARRVGKVTLFCHKELYGLLVEMGNLPGNVTACPLPRVLPPADAFCPIMSLPAALEVEHVEGLPAYLGEIGAVRGSAPVRNVGIAWGGNTAHANGHHRDCPLPYWLRLAEVPGARLHSLQMGEHQAQIAELAAYGIIEDRSPEIANFLDTSKIMLGLDLVISVDTSVAHLAGALGVPCWLLLNQMGRDFRWGGDSEQSRWYASHRQFRRSIDEDTWVPCMNRVKAELERLVAA